jgi:hypothetical protein
MKIISFKQYTILPENKKRKVRAFIVSDTLPNGFPASNQALIEAFPNYIFDTMSVLYITDQSETTHFYVVNEAGNWQEASSQ